MIGLRRVTQARVQWAALLVAVFIVLYVGIFCVFTIERYHRYNATGWDLGIYTQLTWNASQGRPLQNTASEYDNFLALHASYTTVLLSPLFWLWADPRCLLIVQTVVLAAGAWPVARLAGRVLADRRAGPPFALLWLLYPALGWINRWDYHPIALTATFFAFAFEATDRRAWRQADLWLLLALISKEECGMNVAFFALYMAWVYGRRRDVCGAWFVFGMAWFVIHAFVIFPYNRDTGGHLPLHANRYDWLFDGTPRTWWEYLSGPHLELRITYLLKLFGPLAFVPLLAPRRLLLSLPTFALNLLASYYLQFSIYMHYNSAIIPAAMVAAIFGAARLREWLLARRFDPRLLVAGGVIPVVMLLATGIVWSVYSPFGGSGSASIFAWERDAHLNALQEVEKLIPSDACVVADNNIEPHYSVRRETYVIGGRGPGPAGDGDGCQYMISDLGDRRFDSFQVAEEVACYQFWSGQRAPIYFRDTVVVLEWNPAEADPAAWQQMEAYCAAYAEGKQ